MISKNQPLHFKTNVQLKSIIGKDLINNDNIAVLELVKNSYDAGSQRVDVVFKNLKKTPTFQLTILIFFVIIIFNVFTNLKK